MKRSEFLKLSLTATAALVSTSYLGGCAPAFIKKRKPNMLLIMTDQQHIDTIAGMGCDQVRTPWFDKYCTEGVHFRQSYSTNPVCSPARSSILTGRMASETGVYGNNLPIRKEVPNVGQWFRSKSAYDTYYAGKWHLPKSWVQSIPGFDLLTPGVQNQGNIGDSMVSMACEGFFHNRKPSDDPYLMVASLFQPHDICQWYRLNMNNQSTLQYPQIESLLPPLPKNFDKIPLESSVIEDLRKAHEPVKGGWSELMWQYYLYVYYRQVEMVEAEISRILQALEDSGQRENTLVMITSDHGEGMAEHRMIRKNYLYEASAKVPLIVSWPDQMQSNHDDKRNLVSGIDLVPTMCDYAEIASPGNIHSRSLRPLLENRETTWRSNLISEVSHGGHGVKDQLARMVRTDKYKYTIYSRDRVEQLFDLEKDPGEIDNLATKSGYGQNLLEHRNLLKAWESKLELDPDLPDNKKWKNV